MGVLRLVSVGPQALAGSHSYGESLLLKSVPSQKDNRRAAFKKI